MWQVFLSLIPAGAAGVFIFGIYALGLIITSIIACLLTEWLILALRRKQTAILDGSAALTGLLLAYNLPAGVPLWMAVLGSVFAIAIAKQAFGGLGRNIFNPALAARAFLLLSFPKYMTEFTQPLRAGAGFSRLFNVDAVSCATPLTLLKENKIQEISQAGLSYLDLFLGNRGGCIGEVCIIVLLLGALYLLSRRIISWHIPLTFIFSLAVLSWLFSPQGFLTGDWLFSILGGGLILGAFFMATDYVTTPLTQKGKLIFGLGCGLITFIIRRWGGYPEGVSFSILIMNAFTPLIDRFVRPRVYGTK